MIKEAIEKIHELSQKAELDSTVREFETSNGEKYFVFQNTLKRIEPLPVINPVLTSTLKGLEDYVLNISVDDEIKQDFFIQIIDSKNVRLVSPLPENVHLKNRYNYAKAKADISVFDFDHFMDKELFIISLLSNFIPSEDLDYLVRITGNLIESEAVTHTDDGISQKVALKKGIELRAEETIKPIIELIPWSTFPEIQQPKKKFLFRMKEAEKKIKCALFEVINPIHESKTRDAIEEYFSKKLPAIKILK